MDKNQLASLLSLDLFKELGLENIPAEQKMALGEEMIKTVWQMILVRILETLSDEKKDKLYDLMNAGEPEAVNEYLKAEIPDYDNLVQEEIAKYKQMLVASVKQGDQA